jgi:hypothetical protein
MSRYGRHVPRWDSTDPDQLVTPPAVAARLGIKLRTLGQWRNQGPQGPPWVAVSLGAVRYRVRDVEAWFRLWRVRRTATRTTVKAAS